MLDNGIPFALGAVHLHLDHGPPEAPVPLHDVAIALLIGATPCNLFIPSALLSDVTAQVHFSATQLLDAMPPTDLAILLEHLATPLLQHIALEIGVAVTVARVERAGALREGTHAFTLRSPRGIYDCVLACPLDADTSLIALLTQHARVISKSSFLPDDKADIALGPFSVPSDVLTQLVPGDLLRISDARDVAGALLLPEGAMPVTVGPDGITATPAFSVATYEKAASGTAKLWVRVAGDVDAIPSAPVTVVPFVPDPARGIRLVSENLSDTLWRGDLVIVQDGLAFRLKTSEAA